jgi:enamine deaminase RidA (YjgF/YER057c/UK114 family)
MSTPKVIPQQSVEHSWYERLPASPAIQAGDLIFVSGQMDVDSQRRTRSPGDATAQAHGAFQALKGVLAACGASLSDVIDVLSFHRDVREIDAVLTVGREYLRAPYPAWTPVGMTGSYDPEILVVIRAIAYVGKAQKHSVNSPLNAWMQPYPMASACVCDNLVFISGQSGLDALGDPRAPGDHAANSRLAYEGVREVVRLAGGSMDDIVDICSFHLDPRGMVPSERIHGETWQAVPPSQAPCWTAIGVPAMFKPGMLAQYRCIADLSAGPRIGRVSASVHWKNTSCAGTTRKTDGTLIGIAGQVASDGEGNVTTPGDTLSQARYAFNRIRECLELQGASLADVVEITSFHRDARAWEIVMEVGREYFHPARGPAWTPIGVTGLWNPGYLHEIYALAVM